MFSSGPSKSSIQEANRHVQELMKRIADLEEKNRQLERTVEEREQQFHSSLTELSRRFEAEIHETQHQLNDADRQVERQRRACDEKDAVIGELRRRVAVLDSIVPHAEALSEVARLLERAQRTYESVNVGGVANEAFILNDGDHAESAHNGAFRNLAQRMLNNNVAAAGKFSIDDASADDDDES